MLLCIAYPYTETVTFKILLRALTLVCLLFISTSYNVHRHHFNFMYEGKVKLNL